MLEQLPKLAGSDGQCAVQPQYYPAKLHTEKNRTNQQLPLDVLMEYTCCPISVFVSDVCCCTSCRDVVLDTFTFTFGVRYFIEDFSVFNEYVSQKLYFYDAKAKLGAGLLQCDGDAAIHLAALALQVLQGDHLSDSVRAPFLWKETERERE